MPDNLLIESLQRHFKLSEKGGTKVGANTARLKVEFLLYLIELPYMSVNGILLPRKLVEKFIKKENLSGIVDFLKFLKKKKGMDSFYDFYRKNLSIKILPNIDSSTFLFHGSSKLKSVLTPQISTGKDGKAEPKAAVYATDDPNYAIFLAVLNLKNATAGVSAARNILLTVDVDFVNGASKLKHGYVCILANKSFEKLENHEYRKYEATRVLLAIPVIPADLTVPIYIQTG